MIYLDQKECHNLRSIIESQGIRRRETQMIISTLIRWELAYGTKWVVNRLKLMKAALLSGDFTGIKAEGGQFSGPFKAVSVLHAQGRRGRIRADRVLRIYGRWEATSPTTKDFKALAHRLAPKGYVYETPCFKVFHYVTLGPNLGANENLFYKLVDGIPINKVDLKTGLRIGSSARFNKVLPISESKRVPHAKQTERFFTPAEHYLQLTDLCPNLLWKHLNVFEEIFDLNYFEEVGTGHAFSAEVNDMKYDVVGTVVGLTKDRGLKVRYIANPLRFIQLALSRLQDAAACFIKQQPECLVYDQSLAPAWIQSKLLNKEKLWSLDLSNATDSFPVGLQLQVIRDLFPMLSADIDLFEDASSCLFEGGSDAVEIRWTKGQPMGLSPSFAIFTLCHLLLVRSLGGNDGNFRIIGDDIVISDVLLATNYMAAMGVLGVEISKAKSLMAADIAEFAGRIIDREGIYTSYKAGPLDVVRDPLGYLRQYGLSILDCLPRSVRKLVVPVVKLGILFPELSHLRERKLLQQVDSVALLDLLSGSDFAPYPVQRVSTQVSAFERVPTRFEESHLDNQGGFSGLIGSENDPNLAEHVNENIRIGNTSPILESLKATLIPGGALRRQADILAETELLVSSGQRIAEEFWGVKTPISYIRKVYHALNLKDLVAVP